MLAIFTTILLLITLGICIYFLLEYKKYKKSLRQDWANIQVTPEYKSTNDITNLYKKLV